MGLFSGLILRTSDNYIATQPTGPRDSTTVQVRLGTRSSCLRRAARESSCCSLVRVRTHAMRARRTNDSMIIIVLVFFCWHVLVNPTLAVLQGQTMTASTSRARDYTSQCHERLVRFRFVFAHVLITCRLYFYCIEKPSFVCCHTVTIFRIANSQR